MPTCQVYMTEKNKKAQTYKHENKMHLACCCSSLIFPGK